MTNSTLTRRELARRTLAGAAGALLLTAPLSAAEAQAVDATPALPPVPAAPDTAPTEGSLLIKMVPLVAGFALTDTQAREAALQLKDYPGGFAPVRAYAIPDEVGPAFAADAPLRKERVK